MIGGVRGSSSNTARILEAIWNQQQNSQASTCYSA
jgi:hypothetical protein